MKTTATARHYQFESKLAEGQEYERQLDAVFAKWFQVLPATPAQQRQGIDRTFWHVKDNKSYSVEYKADSVAGRTGNAFVETISVDTTNKPGWAVSSQADMLVYLVTEPQTIYCIWMIKLRSHLADWEAKYATKTAQNQGYRTHGILVPLTEFEAIASLVY
jgi:hypothetical protein